MLARLLASGTEATDAELLDRYATASTEAVYGHIGDVHPPGPADVADENAFGAYIERWAGPDWEADFQEFGAALSFDATHTHSLFPAR